jgi:DNA-binding transcriptional ArsR family regulator
MLRRPARSITRPIRVSSSLRLTQANRSWQLTDVPTSPEILLDALGDPTRRAIVERLAEQPRAVGELAAGLPVSRPAVSQHLKVLKDAGLVTERAVGTRRIYRLEPVAVEALRDQLDALWKRALAGFTEIAEQPAEKENES